MPLFDTTTTGVDVVGNYLRDLGAGRMTLTLAYNYNRTRVDNGSTSVATNETQRVLFEDRLRGSAGMRHLEVNVRGRVVRELKEIPATPGERVQLDELRHAVVARH